MKVTFSAKVLGNCIDVTRSDLKDLIGKRVKVIINDHIVIDNVEVYEKTYKGYTYGRLRICRKELEKYTDQVVRVSVIYSRLNDKTVLRLIYGKHMSFKEFWNLIRELDLDDKVELAHKVVEEAIRTTKAYSNEVIGAVAFSGGKASLVTLDIVNQHRCEFDELYVVFCNTLNEFPLNVQYVYKVVREFYKLPLIETVPKVPPIQVWRVFGFPKTSRIYGYTPTCCAVLKELATKVAIEKFNINLEFVGIQFVESRARKKGLTESGLVRRTVRIGHGVSLKGYITRAYPMALFTDMDLWNYIRRNNLPVNPVYEKFKISRQGCLLCTNHSAWREQIAKVNPTAVKIVEKLIQQYGIQEKTYTAKQILDKLGVKDVASLYIIRIYK